MKLNYYPETDSLYIDLSEKKSVDSKEIADGVGKEFGIGVMFSNANMMKPEELRKMVDDGTAKFGKIDVLINNAGIQFVSPVEDFPEEKWNAIITINLTSAFILTKAVWKGMKERKFGRIINIASVVGVTGNPGQCNYVASKAGMIGMTKSMAQEVASRNITLNCVAPGFISSPMTEILTEAQREGILSKIPAGKMGESSDIAKAVAFLASEDASYITGHTLHVNGGMFMN